MNKHRHDPTTDEARNALEAIANALSKAPGKEQEQLSMIATIAICMIHGTFGKDFAREYLRGAVEELDLPDGVKIKLEVRDAGSPSH